MKPFIQHHYVETLGILPALTLLAILIFIVHIDSYIQPSKKKVMRIIIPVVCSLVVQNYADYLALLAEEPHWLLRTLAGIYGYSVRPIILLLFLRLIAPQKSFRWGWGLAGVNAAVQITALFSNICFWIDADGHYHGGPLKNVCLYISLILLICWFIMTLRVFEPRKRKETWVPILVFILIIVAVMMDYQVGSLTQPITYLTIAVIISCVAYYIWLHLQYVREHEEALVAGQRMQIMMTQIQPHFLYNTIATIRALCRRDAEKAGDVAEKFGDYLRQNLDSLNIVGLIPFQKELEHTKIYAEIEMVRFENFRMEYDIRDDDFLVPPLTVQPMVENAIRHGVRIREEGIVQVSAWREGNSFEVMVQDNGVGFDTSRIDSADNSHIGIRNVRERIETMCGGTLKVESVFGEGTKVTISIPIAKEAEGSI